MIAKLVLVVNMLLASAPTGGKVELPKRSAQSMEAEDLKPDTFHVGDEVAIDGSIRHVGRCGR